MTYTNEPGLEEEIGDLRVEVDQLETLRAADLERIADLEKAVDMMRLQRQRITGALLSDRTDADKVAEISRIIRGGR